MNKSSKQERIESIIPGIPSYETATSTSLIKKISSRSQYEVI